MRSAVAVVAAAAAAALLLAAGCSSPATRIGPAKPKPRHGATTPPKLATPPKLVVLLVIDQWPAWSFAGKRPHLRRGFDRLLREGEWHTGEHPTIATITAPSHALLSTGQPSATSGILANEWYRRAPYDRSVKAVEDPDTGELSARALRVPGLGDALAAASTGAKAVAVAIKDRAAIFSLGHAGIPIWYDKKTVAWTSTGAAPPAWLAEHNRRAPLSAQLKHRWLPLDAARLAELSGTTDDQRGEVGSQGLGPTFPHDVGAAKEPAAALAATPLANQLVLDTALAAIDGEHLGEDAVPDLLVVSLSAHDHLGHGWGHESWEAWDMMLRLDEQLERFLGALDAKVGAGRWAMIVTSDHGGSPLPERTGGGRLPFASIRDAANRAASTALGIGDWIGEVDYPTIYFNAAARTRTPRDQYRAMLKIVYALRSFPSLARAELTSDVAGRCETRTGDARAICLALDPVESGEVFYMPARGWILESRLEPHAASHGSMYDYDREVPLIVLPPGRKPHAPAEQPAKEKLDMTKVSGMLAGWLGVTAPSSLPR